MAARATIEAMVERWDHQQRHESRNRQCHGELLVCSVSAFGPIFRRRSRRARIDDCEVHRDSRGRAHKDGEKYPGLPVVERARRAEQERAITSAPKRGCSEILGY